MNDLGIVTVATLLSYCNDLGIVCCCNDYGIVKRWNDPGIVGYSFDSGIVSCRYAHVECFSSNIVIDGWEEMAILNFCISPTGFKVLRGLVCYYSVCSVSMAGGAPGSSGSSGEISPDGFPPPLDMCRGNFPHYTLTHTLTLFIPLPHPPPQQTRLYSSPCPKGPSSPPAYYELFNLYFGRYTRPCRCTISALVSQILCDDSSQQREY